jgi:hypothetical protein
LTSFEVFEILYRHKAGGRNSPRAVNSDYHEGLELLLSRLAPFGTSILQIVVDSAVTRGLPEKERELDLSFPIDIGRTTDIHQLRLMITRAQKSVGRRRDAAPGGGNDQKTIRLTVACHDQRLGFEALRAALIEGAQPVRQ